MPGSFDSNLVAETELTYSLNDRCASYLQVQTISFLSHLRSREVNGPFLIIGPLSTLRNWSGEVKRWCPSMPVLEYHGAGAKARAALRAQHMPFGGFGVCALVGGRRRGGFKALRVEGRGRMHTFTGRANCTGQLPMGEWSLLLVASHADKAGDIADIPACSFVPPPPLPGMPVGPDFPVVVSTYEIVMADIKALARYNWKYIVVDEGHRLKNFNCKLIRDLKTLPADNKLLLTGEEHAQGGVGGVEGCICGLWLWLHRKLIKDWNKLPADGKLLLLRGDNMRFMPLFAHAVCAVAAVCITAMCASTGSRFVWCFCM